MAFWTARSGPTKTETINPTQINPKITLVIVSFLLSRIIIATRYIGPSNHLIELKNKILVAICLSFANCSGKFLIATTILSLLTR